MKILVYSFNDKLGDGLQKISFLQKLKKIYPSSFITYTTTNTTTLDSLKWNGSDWVNSFEGTYNPGFWRVYL